MTVNTVSVIGPSQVELLLVLKRVGASNGRSVAELAFVLGVSEDTVRSSVKRLERRRLVRSKGTPAVFSITREGLRALSRRKA